MKTSAACDAQGTLMACGPQKGIGLLLEQELNNLELVVVGGIHWNKGKATRTDQMNQTLLTATTTGIQTGDGDSTHSKHRGWEKHR